MNKSFFSYVTLILHDQLQFKSILYLIFSTFPNKQSAPFIDKISIRSALLNVTDRSVSPRVALVCSSADLGVSSQLHSFLHGHAIAGVEDGGGRDDSEHGQILQAHLGGSVLTCMSAESKVRERPAHCRAKHKCQVRLGAAV